jgi:hypothetical protein
VKNSRLMVQKKVTNSVNNSLLIKQMKTPGVSWRTWNIYLKKLLASGFKKKTLEGLYGGKLEYEWKIEKEEELVEKIHSTFFESQMGKFKVGDALKFYLLMRRKKSDKHFYVRMGKDNIVTVSCIKNKSRRYEK